MLLELNIKDFAIIDNLNVSFGKGLNILTGETGAGKSIIIDAVKLILGDRAANDVIRTGSNETKVEAVFDISQQKGIKEFLDAAGVDDNGGGTLLIKRLISRTGKNRVFINEGISTISMLSEVGKNLIDIYGQHDHQSLVNPESHINIFDSFLSLISLREKTSESFDRFTQKRVELDEIKERVRLNKERQDFLLFQSHEIESANLKMDEDAELKKEKDRLANREKLFEASNTGCDILYASESSVVERIGDVLNRLKDASRYDESLVKNIETLESCLYQIEDVSANLRDYSQDITFDPKHLEEIDNRLDLISRLKKKYGGSIHEIIDKKAVIDKELEAIAFSDERISALEQEVSGFKKETVELAQELSRKRISGASAFKKAMENELKMLNMKRTVFEVRIDELKDEDGNPKLHSKGMDRVEFFISPNLGEEPKPLAKIASGGELSRIMLAIKRAVALAKGVPVLIFDEIDAGIGGGTAEVVGKKLKEVSMGHQVLCITHLPQIAAYADRHFSVSKTVKNSRTVAGIKELDKGERILEISRMLGGIKITDKARDHAVEMLEGASGAAGVSE